MSWIQTSTESFTVPIDFYDLLSLAADTEAAISAMVNKHYIGKNFHGKHLVKLVSVDDHQEPFVNFNDAFVTMTVSFTAEAIRLLPDKIIPDILVQKSKKSDTHFGIKEISQGSFIRVVFNIGYNDVFNGTIFPTKLNDITHSPHSRDITAVGEILLPYTRTTYYRHDSSTNSSNDDIISPKVISDEVAVVFDKIKQLYITPELKTLDAGKTIISSFSVSGPDDIYTLQGPLGPIIKVSAIDDEALKEVKLVNMFDIEKKMIDASNAIKVISEMYIDENYKKKVQPYIAFVNAKRKSTAVNGGTQARKH